MKGHKTHFLELVCAKSLGTNPRESRSLDSYDVSVPEAKQKDKYGCRNTFALLERVTMHGAMIYLTSRSIFSTIKSNTPNLQMSRDRQCFPFSTVHQIRFLRGQCDILYFSYFNLYSFVSSQKTKQKG